jgi:DNA repair exonuclease SbcCD nuclease subunit
MPHRNDRHLTSRYFAAFRRVIDKAIDLNVDMLLIAGDFFDSNRASQVSTDFALEELARVARPTIISPGNHDCLDAGSVYTRVDFKQAGQHVHVLPHAGARLEFPELETVVWGRGGTEIDACYRPLENLPSRDGDLWHVAMAHGHVMGGDGWEQRWGPISAGELADGDWDYLALGHWDHFADVSQGRMRAIYSGAPVAPREGDAGGCVYAQFVPGKDVLLERLLLH